MNLCKESIFPDKALDKFNTFLLKSVEGGHLFGRVGERLLRSPKSLKIFLTSAKSPTFIKYHPGI